MLFHILKRVAPLKKNHVKAASQDFAFIMSQRFLRPVRSGSVLQAEGCRARAQEICCGFD